MDLGLCIVSDAGSDRLAELCMRLPSVDLPWLLRPAVRQGVQQFIEGFGEQAHPFIQQFLGDLLHRDAYLRQNLHGVVGGSQGLLQGCRAPVHGRGTPPG